MLDAASRRLLHVPSADWDGRQIRQGLRPVRRTTDAVRRLEAAAEQQLRVPVVAFGSARAAIAAVLVAARPPTGRVILPAYTCVAVPNAVVRAGLAAAWIDIAGPNLDPARTAASRQRGDAVIVQHTYGVPPARDLVADAVADGAFVIEDRAHRFDGDAIEGDAAVWSLEHSKVVSGGRGGLVWARDGGLLTELRRLRDAAAPIDDRTAGRVLRTSAVQAGLVRLGGPAGRANSFARRVARRLPVVSAEAQSPDELAGHGVEITAPHPALAEMATTSIQRSPRTLDHRRAIATRYRERLGGLVPDWLPPDLALVRMPIVVADAVAATTELRRAGWDLGVRWFEAPVHPAGSVSDYAAGSAPAAERLAATILTLPTHPGIDHATADRLIDAVLALQAS